MILNKENNLDGTRYDDGNSDGDWSWFQLANREEEEEEQHYF